ncbi:MAG TPA: glycosyltransferase [archaeon]|nr:glycosyltransferase [archaeon]
MLSVCVPVWNESERTLQSLLNGVKNSTLWQRETEKELLFCVNGELHNGPTMKGLARLSRLTGSKGLFRVLWLEKKGQNFAWEELIRKSNPRSENLFFIDADVHLEKGTLKGLDDALRADSHLLAAGAVVKPLAEKFKPWEVFRKRVTFDWEKQDFLSPACCAIRRHVLSGIEMIQDPRIGVDLYLGHVLKGRFKIVPSSLVKLPVPGYLDYIRQNARWGVAEKLMYGTRDEPRARKNEGSVFQRSRDFLNKGVGDAAFSLLMKASRPLINRRVNRLLNSGGDTWGKIRSQRKAH